MNKYDTFEESPRVYYETVEELIYLLDISYILQPRLEEFTVFLNNDCSVFSKHDLDIGCVKDYYAKVTMNQEVKDVSMKYIPVPKNLRKRVTAMVDRYKSSGIMAECEEDVLDPFFVI